LAARYGLSEASLRRHKAEHLPQALARAHDVLEASTATDLLSQVQELQERTLRILEQAEGRGNVKVALQAIREARGNLELLGKVAAAMAIEQQRQEQERRGNDTSGPYHHLPVLQLVDMEIRRLEAEL